MAIEENRQPIEVRGLPFDLNIGEVLEHWTVPFAIREIIANALDEQTLTGTTEPVICPDSDGRWHITDYGRGLRHEHLTASESGEKLASSAVIGQFGMGLKDALAVFDRHQIGVEIHSPHGDITTVRLPKESFEDVITLHALVSPPTEPTRTGTDVILSGVSRAQIEEAQRFFLAYSGEEVLESTRLGQVLSSPPTGQPAHIYVKGLLVAQEENFLFSYNITNLSASLRRALNRERSNVGRSAYSDRVKAILQACETTAVAGPLSADLGRYTAGSQHDELAWKDVAVHACRVLSAHQKVVFVTARQLEDGAPQLQYAKADGYKLVTIPDDIASKVAGTADVSGRPIMDFGGYQRSWNESFTFDFVAPDEMSSAERGIFNRVGEVTALASIDLQNLGVKEVAVSTTMRLSSAGDPVLGIWEPDHRRIVIRRDQLASPQCFFGTLLHELGHARSGASDNSLGFEEELTRLLGAVAAAGIQRDGAPVASQEDADRDKKSATGTPRRWHRLLGRS